MYKRQFQGRPCGALFHSEGFLGEGDRHPCIRRGQFLPADDEECTLDGGHGGGAVVADLCPLQTGQEVDARTEDLEGRLLGGPQAAEGVP